VAPFGNWDGYNAESGTTVNSGSVVEGYAFTGVEVTSLVVFGMLTTSVCSNTDISSELLAIGRSSFEPEREYNFFEPSKAEDAGTAATMNEKAKNAIVCLPLIMLI
jgi:uncharacterized protein YjbK